MDFKFNGLPDNDFFDNGEEENESNNISDILKNLGNEADNPEIHSIKISFNDLMNSLLKGNSGLSALNAMMDGSNGMEKLLKELLNELPENDDCDGDCENCDEDCEKFHEYELGKYTMLTNPDNFAAVECIESPTLYYDFIEKFGNGPWKLSIINQMGIYGAKLDFDLDSELTYLIDTDKYILFLVEPTTEGKSSSYLAAIKEPSGDFAFVVPAYGNIYDPKTEEIFTTETYPEYFDSNGAFIFSDLSKVEFGLNACLSTKKKTMINIENVGIVKPRRKSYNDSGKYLLIGSLKMNDSVEATMLKRDAGFSDDKEDIELYAKFNEDISAGELNSLSEWFSKLDLNQTLFVENKEVYSEDGFLYVNCVRPKCLENLKYWKEKKGNWDIE